MVLSHSVTDTESLVRVRVQEYRGGTMNKVRWGVLSTANIGMKKVLPAMQRSERCEIVAIASRDEATARAAAAQLGIPKAYGSYEALLADPEIDAIYNPLPNHLHVPWSIKAIRGREARALRKTDRPLRSRGAGTGRGGGAAPAPEGDGGVHVSFPPAVAARAGDRRIRRGRRTEDDQLLLLVLTTTTRPISATGPRSAAAA